MTKFKLIVVPSSDDEPLFEETVKYDEAKKIVDGEENVTAQEFIFNSEHEREIFLQGYMTAIGFLGSGTHYKKEE